MNRRVVFQRKTESQDAIGHPTPTWNTYIKRWAHIERVPTIRRSEEFLGRQFRAEGDHIFEIRYDSQTATITPEDRVFYNSSVYDIQSVFDVAEAHKKIEIFAYVVQ